MRWQRILDRVDQSPCGFNVYVEPEVGAGSFAYRVKTAGVLTYPDSPGGPRFSGWDVMLIPRECSLPGADGDVCRPRTARTRIHPSIFVDTIGRFPQITPAGRNPCGFGIRITARFSKDGDNQMEYLNTVLHRLFDFIPTGVAVVLIVIFMFVIRALLTKRYTGKADLQFRRQLTTMVLSLVGLVVIILTLPVGETTIGQLLSLLGLLLSAAIALSATTFLGNIMAGLMLRAIRNFRAGDFVKIGDHFGRVSERGLFHVEIQTENRDLTTLPNLYLVTNPVKVIRESGTLVTAEVSLGYDVSRTRVEKALLAAVTDVGLTEPFVLVGELGDFSVTYRAAGLLIDVKSLISTRSHLREQMLDRLHEAGIEIVSPTFMNQRVLPLEKTFIPKPSRTDTGPVQSKEAPEAVVFDKADEAESLEKLRFRLEEFHKEYKDLKKSLDEAAESEKPALEKRLLQIEASRDRLAAHIEEREKETNGK